MKYTVKYLPSLHRDIYRIGEVLTEHPKKARRLLKEMDEKLLQLEDMPFIWPIFSSPEDMAFAIMQNMSAGFILLSPIIYKSGSCL